MYFYVYKNVRGFDAITPFVRLWVELTGFIV